MSSKRLVGQPVESNTLRPCLYPDQPYSCHSTEEYRTGQSTGQHHSAEAAEDWWCDHQKYPPYPASAL